ncbi:MAG: preprotein translocase subunit SecA [Sarcina sp.]
MSIFKSYDEKELKALKKLARKILNLDNEIKELSDQQLSQKTFEFKERFNNGESLEKLLVEAFAVCREATFRVLGKKQYKVQIMGGIALHQGRVVEMKTGEGKTLTELCPAYLNALTGKGVHIITVNDYLAQRDMEEMRPLFEFLNISVGLVIDGLGAKKSEYAKDVVYSTNTELGFDYLRDNTVLDINNKVQRKLNYVIIDEVDSVLIDEARTPLIISRETGEATKLYEIINNIIGNLSEDDYKKEEKENQIYLTEEGVAKVEKILAIDNLSDVKYTQINHIISQSLRANYMMFRDKDYIVHEGEIVLIDMNTGRIAEGRRYSDGLHQCLEAKEKIRVNPENETIATITYQNFFRLYDKMSGMSGTVKTEEEEFREIYNLDVVVIPTNKPIRRIDKPDKVYLTEEYKLEAIIEDIKTTRETGQPILVGTLSIDKSEELSALLNKHAIKHRLLNAKTKQAEAEIISKAGEKGAITIATNIAGRGTDIKVSDEINELGGLKVIGTERSESRRIDNQLIGRSGRQGNNGVSQFYLSCEDKLLSVYGEGKLKKKLEKSGFKNEEINVRVVRNQIKRAQQVINGMYFEMRKETIKYDEVVNKQRDIVYKERDEVLSGGDIAINISNMMLDSIFKIVIDAYEETYPYELDFEVNKENVLERELDLFDHNSKEMKKFYLILLKQIRDIFKIRISGEEFKEMKQIHFLADLIDYITTIIIGYFNKAMNDFEWLNDRTIRLSLVQAVDICWIEHINEMDCLRSIVRDQAYNQKKPVDVYKVEGQKKSEEMNTKIKITFVKYLFDIIKQAKENAEILAG